MEGFGVAYQARVSDFMSFIYREFYLKLFSLYSVVVNSVQFWSKMKSLAQASIWTNMFRE